VSAASASPAFAAEIMKLARLLDVDADALGFLEALDVAEIRELRRQISDCLFDADQDQLTRVASASKLLPSTLVAAISQRAFGPLLAARITGFMDVRRAVDVGKQLDPAFLADICVQMDPRKAREIVPRMDVDTVVAVSEELLDRGDFVTMGRFVGLMPAKALRSVLGVTEDDELLRVCAVAESVEGVDEIFAMLSAERLQAVRRRATRKDLRQEALALRDRL
jgi:molybdenum cofactor biosynthesis enzyme